MRLRVFALLIVLLGLVLGASAQNGPNPMLYQPNENILGMSYGDWSAAWWQWMLQFTNDISPYNDLTGVQCGLGQGGPVFFLAGAPSPTTRSCIIHGAKVLFIPLYNAECSTIEAAPWHADNGSQARVCAAPWVEGTTGLKFVLDGKKAVYLTSYRAQSPYFYFNVPTDNNFIGTTGPTEGWSVSDGWWVAVKPLIPGIHTLHFEAGGQKVTYILTVTK